MPSERDRCITIHPTTEEELDSYNATLYVVVSGEYKNIFRTGTAELWVDLFPIVNSTGEETRKSEYTERLREVTSIAEDLINGHKDEGSDKAGFRFLSTKRLESNMTSMIHRWRGQCYTLFTEKRDTLQRHGCDLIIGDKNDFRVWAMTNGDRANTYLNKITGPATARSSASASQA